MKKQLHQDVYIGFVCLAICLLIFALNAGLPSDAALMPRLLGGMLVVLAVLILYGGLKKSRLPAEEQGKKAITWDAMKIPLITWGFVVLYFVLFNVTGYFVATAIMIPLLMRFMKQTSWPVIIGIDAVYLVIMYVVFARMLNVSVDNLGMLGQLF